MKSLALRFGDNFAPECGTINAHMSIIKEYGYVWYGKFGNHLCKNKTDSILKENNPRVLLIHSGTLNRYWAYVSDIVDHCDEHELIPDYYREKASGIKTWLKIWKIESAKNNVMRFCKVSSSNEPLSIISRSSLSPFFFIDFDEEGYEKQ